MTISMGTVRLREHASPPFAQHDRRLKTGITVETSGTTKHIGESIIDACAFIAAVVTLQLSRSEPVQVRIHGTVEIDERSHPAIGSREIDNLIEIHVLYNRAPSGHRTGHRAKTSFTSTSITSPLKLTRTPPRMKSYLAAQ